jgi:hypothetical protein
VLATIAARRLSSMRGSSLCSVTMARTSLSRVVVTSRFALAVVLVLVLFRMVSLLSGERLPMRRPGALAPGALIFPCFALSRYFLGTLPGACFQGGALLARGAVA